MLSLGLGWHSCNQLQHFTYRQGVIIYLLLTMFEVFQESSYWIDHLYSTPFWYLFYEVEQWEAFLKICNYHCQDVKEKFCIKLNVIATMQSGILHNSFHLPSFYCMQYTGNTFILKCQYYANSSWLEGSCEMLKHYMALLN